LRTSGSKSVLSAEAALRGRAGLKGTRAPKITEVYSQIYYDKKVKDAADRAIAEEDITSRGSKLQKRLEVTLETYEAESPAVKAKVMKKHQKAMKKFQKARNRTKSGVRERVDDSTKIKYALISFS
jgi:hypothetical protein